MELRHLRYFVAVAEELSFRRAADRLHLSQPALGRQVRDLEDEVGSRLLDRNRNGVELTVPGALFLESARGLLRDADEAIQSVSEAVRGERGRIHIGNVAALSAWFLPKLLASFYDEAPRVDVEVLELGPDEQCAALLDNEIQVGFQGRTSADEALDPRFASMTVMRSNAVVVMSKRHPLAAARSVPVSALEHETLLNFRAREGTGYERWLRALCADAGFSPKLRRPALENPPSLFAMVAANQGLAVLTEGIAHLFSGPKSWVVRPLAGPVRECELVAVYRRDHASLVLTKFLALLAKQAPYASRARRGR